MSPSILVAAMAASVQPAEPAKPVPVEEVARMEVGIWDADITFPSNEAGKPDGKARGVQENELRSDGKWMLNRFSVEGTNYQGTGVWGFDRATGRLTGIWTDNNDRIFRYDDGRWDPETMTITWSANMALPDGRYQRLLTTEKFEGEKRTFRMVALTRQGEVPLVHMVFTRRAGSAAASPAS